LSMVLRMIDEPSKCVGYYPFTDKDEKKKNYKQSIQLANKAVGLDLSDSQSWCTFIGLTLQTCWAMLT
jgi:hypothetical protein